MGLKAVIMSFLGLPSCRGAQADALRREVRATVHDNRNAAAAAVAVAHNGTKRADHITRMAEDAIASLERARGTDGTSHHP
jgi:hypothetical protein